MTIENCGFCTKVFEDDELLQCYYCGDNVCRECADVDSKGNEVCPGCYPEEDDDE